MARSVGAGEYVSIFYFFLTRAVTQTKSPSSECLVVPVSFSLLEFRNSRVVTEISVLKVSKYNASPLSSLPRQLGTFLPPRSEILPH